MPPKFFVIEEQWSRDESSKYRFKSLYNNAVGVFRYNKIDAVEDGYEHTKIILFLHDKKVSDWK